MQEPVIEISNLRFSWAAASPIVVDIESLCVANAEPIFLRGPSGSGKSTR
jgi:ABC-type bacteriocin/lantibiotic exporter with double-glycine peptidase domain